MELDIFSSKVGSTYLVSVFVCCVCEYVTTPFPFARSNIAVIDPLPSTVFDAIPQATSTSLVSSAALITSSPQHIFACFRRLLVDAASALSTNCFTDLEDDPFPLQDLAVQVKTGACRPLKYSISGIALKNAYIGDFHPFRRHSISTKHQIRFRFDNSLTQLCLSAFCRLFRRIAVLVIIIGLNDIPGVPWQDSWQDIINVRNIFHGGLSCLFLPSFLQLGWQCHHHHHHHHHSQ